MFSESFDWVLAIVLAVISVLMFSDKGEFILDMFDGKRENPRKKWPPQKQRKFSKVMGVFTGGLALAELLLALFGQTYPLVNFGVLIAMIIFIIAVLGYIKKNF